jgi:competence protein ComFC
MKCIICQNYSFKHICKTCQNRFLTPHLITRILPDGFKIYSFYHYSDIEDLIKTKHTHIGAAVYTILAEIAFRRFANEFSFPNRVYALAIDDHVQRGYSHTAILTKALKSKNIVPVYSSLRANNHVTYSAKSLEYRLQNPRDFNYSFKSKIDAILVDDIVTSSTTLNEAKNKLLKYSVEPLFALTLADARKPK